MKRDQLTTQRPNAAAYDHADYGPVVIYYCIRGSKYFANIQSFRLIVHNKIIYLLLLYVSYIVTIRRGNRVEKSVLDVITCER